MHSLKTFQNITRGLSAETIIGLYGTDYTMIDYYHFEYIITTII